MASTTSFAAIITTLLDTDAYKLHMQQAVFHQLLNVPASYEFINRNNDDHLGKYADEIREQISAMATVSLTDDEYQYLQKLPYMKEDYLQYLRRYRFNPSQVEVLTCPTGSVSNNNKYNEDDTDLVLRVSGPWLETILWEVPLLAIISEVAQRHRHPTIGVDEAKSALFAKLDEFVSTNEGRDLSEFRVTDFGTRRRFSKAVQEEVVRILSTDPRFRAHFFGTSNYDLARRMNLTPVGTQAHEWFQAFQQLAPSLRESQTCALDTWIKEYPGQLGIALTDCITMDAFLKDFDARLANSFVGLRHDSGDPFTWGDKAIDHYNSLGIDPLTKTLVFSDGLNLQKAVELFLNFQERVRVMFGIGTSLTCAISGVKPMNIVIKMIRCQNSPVAKVSDAPGKNCCDDPDYVVVLKKTFMVS